MRHSWAPYLNELEKRGVKLTKEEKRRQALQFAGIGAASVPVISGATNLLTYGKVSPWAPMKRWLPAQIVGGALAGGAVPAVQHALARSNIERAKARRLGEKVLSVAKPSEVAMAVKSKALPIPLAKAASIEEALEGADLPPEAAAMLAGGRAALSSGRSVAGRSAAKLSPRGREQRAKDLARGAAWIGSPLGALGMLALGRRAGLARKAATGFSQKYPKGVFASPKSERAVIRFLTHAGTAAAGGLAGGLATGGLVGAGQQLQARRDMKKGAAQGGQDLRMRGSVPGGITKPPTQDSKAFASKQLRMSSAEVGPVQPSRAGARIEDIIPKYNQSSVKSAASSKSAPYQQTRKGRRPIRVHNLLKKASDAMDPMLTDPLVVYLKKQAAQPGANNEAKDPPPKGKQSDGPVKDNEPDMPTGQGAKELSSEPPLPTTRMERGILETHAETKEHFDNAQGITAKGSEKEFPYDPGVVDRVLGL